MAGIARQQESPSALKARPFFQYDAINDSRTRPSHAALDNVIAPADSPFWQTHTPPLGYRCRCTRIGLSAAQAKARGYDAAKALPDVQPDTGFAGHPLADDGWAGIKAAIEARLVQRSGVRFAARRGAPPLWCNDGPFRDHALMHAAWAERKGAMPEPRELIVDRIQKGMRSDLLFSRFMDEFGGGKSATVDLPSGDRVSVSGEIFRTLDGDWKIGNRGRDQWLLYIAETIKRPQEIWRLKLAMSEELYLFGRFQRGSERIDTVAVFKRGLGDDQWNDGKTAYAFDRVNGLDEKRDSIVRKKACVQWVEV